MYRVPLRLTHSWVRKPFKVSSLDHEHGKTLFSSAQVSHTCSVVREPSTRTQKLGCARTSADPPDKKQYTLGLRQCVFVVIKFNGVKWLHDYIPYESWKRSYCFHGNEKKKKWRKWMGNILPNPRSLLCSIVSWQAWLAQFSCHHTQIFFYSPIFFSSASQLTLNPNFSISRHADVLHTDLCHMWAEILPLWAQSSRTLACLSHWLGKELFFVKWKCPAGCDAQFISSIPGRFDKWHGCSPPLHAHTQWHSLSHDCLIVLLMCQPCDYVN